MQCRAKSRRSGERCRRWAVTGKEVCQMHGGATPSGAAASRFKTGRYSMSLPDRLASDYLRAGRDPELTSVREELALTDARVADLLSRVDSGESGGAWAAIADAVEAYRSAKDDAGRAGAFAIIASLTADGREDYAAWDEVHKLIEQRRKLVETEAKRLDKLQQTITAERAMLLVGAAVGVIRAHVHDRATLGAISRGVARLIGGGGDGTETTSQPPDFQVVDVSEVR